jgi:hypothetical protein
MAATDRWLWVLTVVPTAANARNLGSFALSAR